MAHILRLCAVLWVGLILLSSWLPPLDAADIRLGAAAVKINPPNGTALAGYYGARGSQGVLDDIFAKAVVFDDGKTKAAMVVCDLIGIPRAPVLEARRLIEAKTGIPAANVMISATHTHTGPMVVGDTAIDDLVTEGSKLNQDYTAQLPKWIAQAVEEAAGHLTPARVSYGRESEPNLSFIRRFWMKDGTVGWNPGKLNPNIIRPIGVIDPQVNVVYAQSPDKKPLLTYVNFANHLDTTGGFLVSADYPCALARSLAEHKGPEMLTIFGNGTCGNINHIDVTSAVPQGSPAEAKRIGMVLAASVLKAYLHLTDVEDATLRVRHEVVELAPAKFTEDELRIAREIVAKRGKGFSFLEQVKAYRITDDAAQEGKPFDADVQVFSLGQDIAWVALPGEVFVELGLSIKAASPFRQTNVIELSNGRSGYVPNHSAFSEGQYEVVSTRYAEGSGEQLVSAALRMMNELHAEASAAAKPTAPPQ
jgi:hypothetical protein